MNAHLAKPVRMERLYERMVQCLPNVISSTLTFRDLVERTAVRTSTISELSSTDQVVGFSCVDGQRKHKPVP